MTQSFACLDTLFSHVDPAEKQDPESLTAEYDKFVSYIGAGDDDAAFFIESYVEIEYLETCKLGRGETVHSARTNRKQTWLGHQKPCEPDYKRGRAQSSPYHRSESIRCHRLSPPDTPVYIAEGYQGRLLYTRAHDTSGLVVRRKGKN